LSGLGLGITNANAAAINMTIPGGEYSGGPYTLGFEFRVINTEAVGSLGVYDSGMDGIAAPATVGIWDTSGNLLVSAVVPSGTAGRLDGFFRYVDITPFTLIAGIDYVIGSYLNDTASSYLTGQGGAGSVDPNVVLVNNRYGATGTFAFPDVTTNTGGAWLGANFEAAAVPEPATLALIGLGLLGFGMVRRRKQ
jgi:hypothetical protein